MNDFLKLGGLVSCLSEITEQWDSPNGWAPLQWFAVQVVLKYGYKVETNEMMVRWLTMLEKDFATRRGLEKYNVVLPENTTGGGEYQVQQGFGWRNGVTSRFYTLLR
ncbi:alpha,alpha-trehalase [Pseudoalteromonas sp. MMG012]|uniref:alpha,alpha-trehalase n=1 Tax=Pseudoalteromonas sp. MMG012 TaxID=2822686 RepID=UPI001FFCB061|nr:alpha,alpha-trehalase [Pseudoalteromonas sp. MMG012]